MANSQGTPNVRTADLSINGVGQVDPLTAANDGSDPPSGTAGAIVTPSVPICVPGGGCTFTLPIVWPGTAGYVPSNATLDSGNQNNDGNTQTPIIDDKIGKQLPERGWTTQDIQNAMNNGATGTAFDKRSASKAPDGLPRNDTATVYGSKDGYVVVNDRTGEIVQISDKTDSGWIVDSRIQCKGK